jgi:hypothetical protein
MNAHRESDHQLGQVVDRLRRHSARTQSTIRAVGSLATIAAISPDFL